MKLSLAYSPCPNDCFIFDAMIHGKVDTEGLTFDVRLEDVETLNHMAVRAEMDITKLSFHAYGHVMKQYILLRSGSALGFNCGPLLIHNGHFDNSRLEEMSVAIPGELTTANFLLSLAYPQLKNKKVLVFHEIEDAVLRGDVDAGLIIHENRFTYERRGLQKVRDLGEYWEELIHAPIPLGGIVIRRDMDAALQQKVNRVIQRSVTYALEHPESSMPYVREHAQEMEEAVMRKHIDLYVNEFSVNLGETGRKAVALLFSKASQAGLFASGTEQLMID